MSTRKKVLLMGRSGAGKTSMRSIIFANYIARDTRRLAPTVEVEHSRIKMLGNLTLNLWDCGGQESYMESFLNDNIFRNVEVLIYVFDVESMEFEKDLFYYQSCLQSIQEFSPEAKVFCLVHKMDLVEENLRDDIFKQKAEQFKDLSKDMDCTCFRTSIWDETLYRAWSSIVYTLIPNVKSMENSLGELGEILDADEVLLLEKSSFLVISHAQRNPHEDVHRFEKISNIIKQFKLCSNKIASAQFHFMEVRNSNFSAFFDILTKNTYVMVIVSDCRIPSEAIVLNVEKARERFEELERPIQSPRKMSYHSSDRFRSKKTY